MAVSLSDINAVVTKTLNWLRDRMVPTGTIICGLYTAPPAGYLAFKRTDQILKTQYPALCTILFEINGFKGDGSTYANIPDVDHRVIEMCSNVSEVGQLMEAALPNITGTLPVDGYVLQANTSQITGAFGTKDQSHTGRYAGPAGWKLIASFSASACSSIYSGSAFQAPSLRTLAIIKS